MTYAGVCCTSFLLAVSSWLWFIALSLCPALAQGQTLLVLCPSPVWSCWHLPSTGFVTHSLVFHRLRLQLGQGSFCQVLLPSSNGLGIVVTFHPLIYWQTLYILILLLLLTAAVMGCSQALTLSRSVLTQGSLLVFRGFVSTGLPIVLAYVFFKGNLQNRENSCKTKTTSYITYPFG